MPPSIPAQEGPHDGATTHLQLVRERSRNKHSVNSIKPTHHLTLAKERKRSRRLTAPTKRLRKGENKRQLSSSSSRRHKSEKNVGNASHASVENDSSSTNATPVGTAQTPTSLETGLAPYGGIGTISPYGFYGGAASMMPPSPYMGMNTMGLPYVSGLNQVVYNIQNIIFSVSQAIYMIGANQQALQQAWESLNQMVDHAVATFHEMRALESIERQNETEEETKKRKRLKALRYAFVFGGGWLAYKLVRNLLFRKRNLHQRKLSHQSTPFMSSEDHHYGQSSYLNNMTSLMSGRTAAMPNYSSSSPMGYSGYSGNYYGGSNEYY